MFLDIDKKNPNKIAVIDDSGTELSYGLLCEYAEKLNKALPYFRSKNRKRTIKKYYNNLKVFIRKLLLIDCR